MPRLRRSNYLAATLAVLALGTACTPPAKSAAKTPRAEVVPAEREDPFELLDVTRTAEPSPYFVRDGAPFCFSGTNNYYLTYQSEAAVLDLLDVAAKMKLKVLRMWAFLDRGSLDGQGNIREPGHKEGFYFQYWDPAAGRPAYNDGPTGLQRLDWVLHEAKKRDLLVTLVLSNNWRDFGGMDQYLRWYGLRQHHLFYQDERVRQAFKDWIFHLVTRTSTVDGTRYIDDPTIFAWELANEPRTVNFEDYDAADGWDKGTILRWAEEMSAYIKSLDPNHMVAVGDEGFLASGPSAWPYEAPYGVDSEAFARLPSIDFGTYHLYPDHWGLGQSFGNDWIEAHIAASRRVNKPMLLEEYGIHVRRKSNTSGPVVQGLERRQVAYRNWNELVLERGGSGSMFWILAGIDSAGQLYPDYDHFTVYDGDDSFRLLADYAGRMPSEAAACALATGHDHGPKSSFVSWRPTPASAIAAGLFPR
jgi:mannan endo-1,4-beta-mannosidase